MKKQNVLTGIAGCLIILLLFANGCGKKELTSEEVKATDTYQNLETKYNELERKYEKMKASVPENQETDVSADACLKRIKRSDFIRVKVSKVQDGRYEISDNRTLIKWAKKSFSNAIATQFRMEEFLSEQTSRFTYTLYNEDNTVSQCSVYEDDYVVFDEIPDTVYYVAGASRLGLGTFGTEQSAKLPSRSFETQLYESQMAYEQDRFLEEKEIRTLALSFQENKGTKSESKPADVEGASKREYIFRCDGDTFVMEVYTKCFSITKNGNEVKWYETEAQKVDAFLQCLN